MTILHVTDFHFNKSWFDWLLDRAPAHDVTVFSGDLLDLAVATPQRRQIEWVSQWLSEYPRPMCVSSGNHDLEWNSEAECWMPAYWLRDVVNPLVWTDGQRVFLNGMSFLNIGAATHPKGGDADVWVVHAPPSKTLVARRADGVDAGDPDLVSATRRHAPRLMLAGHVHSPTHWREQRNGTLLLNPGCSKDAPFPNHILVNTDDMSGEFRSASLLETRDGAFSSALDVDDEFAATTPALA